VPAVAQKSSQKVTFFRFTDDSVLFNDEVQAGKGRFSHPNQTFW
jgi:hypothetical protein